ncbi:putative zinc-ribbon domain, plant [Sesbania bispinosa]|nr:putative zinc-ribbon domain, plant [Sesbania bispinosa]
MSGEVVPEIRVVRCPKCKLLLPEPQGCDLYKCGGCGITLKAKRVAVKSKSSIQVTDSAPRNTLDLVSKDNQFGDRKHLVPPREDDLKAKATTSSGECYLDENVGKGQNENGEYNGSQLVPCNVSDEELESELDIYKLSLRRHRGFNKGSSNKTTHCEIEEINDEDLLFEGSKEELICASDENGNNDKSSLIGVTSEMEITGSDLEGAEELSNGNSLPEGAEEEIISGSDGEDANKDKPALAGANPEVEIIRSDLGVEDLNNGNLLPEGTEEELLSGLDGEDANNHKSGLVGGNLEVEITGSNISGGKLNNGKLLLEGAEQAEQELNLCAPDGEDPNNDQSAIEDAKSEVDSTESASTTERSSTEKGSILQVTPDNLEEGTSGNPVSSNKQQKQAKKYIHHSSDRVSSLDTLDATEVVDPSSELSGVLGKLSKFPTTRSSYAYDGSRSSYDGMDKRFPNQHLDSLKNSYTVAEGRTRKGKGLVNGLLYGDLGTQHQSHMPNERHHVMKDSRRNKKKVLENTRHGNPHWMRDEFPSRMPFHLSSSQSLYESGSPSNRMNDKPHHSSSFVSPDSLEDTDQEKMKLYRMIYKLQDQLNRTRYMSGDTNGRLSTGVSYKGNHISAYHRSRDLHEGMFSHALDHPRCNGRCNHGIWRQRHNKYSRIPYSDEATSNAHNVDHSCFHCFPHFSADLPPHAHFQHEDLCRSYPGQDCCSSHHSYPSNPQWFTASKLPVFGSENKSDDQRHRAPEVRKYLREKINLAKRHQRPVAGGAPFVTCPKCLMLLQLPADFLLFKRACHQLKCGECSEILKFSLQNGSHIVSFSSNATDPPSSELNDQSEVIGGSFLPSASHANYYQYSYTDPISYYDDYGVSVSKSYSSEGDPVSVTQFHPLHGSEYDNPSVSRGTFESLTEKEKIASRYSSTNKASLETDESTDLSSSIFGSRKLSTAMEARLPPKKPSLHRLMGYSSPSQVIRGTRPYIEGKGAHTPLRK